jgi:hypothetical protein
MMRHVVRMMAAAAVVLASALGAIAGDPTAADAGSSSELAAPAVLEQTTSAFVAGGVCLARNTPEQLSTLFDTAPGGVIGADYQRATPLPNGKVLWTFQDAEVRLPDGSTTLVHNIGMVQDGTCFSVLMNGSQWNPQPWLFPASTVKFSHWYWPLDAAMGTDGRVYIFTAEMYERGQRYLTRVEPTSTVIAGVDIDTLAVEFLGAPADASNRLYGWSIESDDDWTYLYAHCYRQFGFDPFFDVLAHDRSCSNIVTVARVPRGQLFAAPEYWSGAGWSRRRADAVPVIERAGRMVNASDIVYRDNRWLAVTKVDDWFGRQIFVESAARPTGPFERIATLTAPLKCPQDCNTYYASWVPSTDASRLTIGLSHNRWDGIFTAVYRPSFFTIPKPAFRFADAARCSIGHCD